MMYHRPTLLSERQAHELTSLVFVKLAETAMLDDVTINEHPTLFPMWNENWTGKAGYGRDGIYIRHFLHNNSRDG